MHRMIVVVWCAAACWAQSPNLTPDTLLLSRIKAQMVGTLRKQPNYTCVQHVERSQRLIPRQRFELVDMLRLEVALVDGHELFAWPGSKKFEDTDLRHMVSGGAIGNGNFALHARAVFMSDGPVFSFRGEDQLKGRRAFRFDFKVSLLNSGYRIRANDQEAVVAYRGSFWADPVTSDLLRLDVEAEDIPKALRLNSATDRMDYSRMKIGGGEFLLPSGSELTMVDLNGNESRNRTRFESCRQYMGESVLSFADPGEAPAASRVADDPPQDLPGGLIADTRLETDIDSNKAMVGDAIEVTLEHPLKYKHKLLVPRGATLSGRIVRMEHRNGDSLLELQFTEGKFEHSHWNLVARVEDVRVAGFGSPGGGFEKSISSQAPAQIGTIYVKGSNHIHLYRGSRMTLRTESTQENQ